MIDLGNPEVAFALMAIRQASLLVKQVQAEMVSAALTKEDRSPVTVADFAAQALVAHLLEGEFPEDPLVAEEDAGSLRPQNGGDRSTLKQVTEFVSPESGAFMKSLIQKIVEIPGPSGFEAHIREFIRQEVEPLAGNAQVDSLGNLIVTWGERKPGGHKILLAAHMDEIGLMATHVDERGFVRFTTLGGVRPVNCLGGRVRFLHGVQGVVGSERLSDASKAPAFEHMFIDVGAASQAENPVSVGDVAAFERPFLDLGNRRVAKSMDDRIGVAVLIETLRTLIRQEINSPHQVVFLFSVQEEVGVRGATTVTVISLRGLDRQAQKRLNFQPIRCTISSAGRSGGIGRRATFRA